MSKVFSDKNIWIKKGKFFTKIHLRKPKLTSIVFHELFSVQNEFS